MLPYNQYDLSNINIKEENEKTHYMDIQNKNIIGFISQKEALKQAIYKILNTERAKYLMYSRNYGISIEDLYGESTTYVISQLQDRIIDALSLDNRILEINNFTFYTDKNIVSVYFDIKSIYGDLNNNNYLLNLI